ncbi:replication restart DNA helicase PriA [Deinococcus reticulitermitis]|uniref:Probable replication restart protein PriA n=1 Tax=Deinococcus reticulitermitis TaxID=856736 RepID=A0A1H7CLF5_9DEIO|nr:replication restart DNA helicase PriA [Deinococcus reticulitermitis]
MPLPIAALDFAAPHGFEGEAPLGCRVLVPWKGELRVGLVVGEAKGGATRTRLREVVHLLDEPAAPWVPPATVRGVCGWAQDARIPAGLIWGDLLGVGWTPDYDHAVRAVSEADLSPFGADTPDEEWREASLFSPLLLDAVREQGLLEERFCPRPRFVTRIRAREPFEVPPSARTVSAIGAQPWETVDAALRERSEWQALNASETAGLPPLTLKQASALEWLRGHGPVTGLPGWARGAGVGAAVVRRVVEAGYAREVRRPQAPPAIWHWLREHGPVPSLNAWAQGAGVSLLEVSRLLNAGGADYTFAEAPPPPAWRWLREHGPTETLSAWAQGAGVSPGAVSALVGKGWAEYLQQPAPPPELPAPQPTPDPRPAEELLALTSDLLPETGEWRLHGGREGARWLALAPRLTRLLAQGRGVLVLVPDRATLARAWEGLSGYAEVAGTRAAQLTGLLTPRQREEAWRQIREGEARLVIGSPHALGAPLSNLALVVVLEEGSDAYKLLSGSRAFVPDLAARVAREWGAALGNVGTVPAVESAGLPGVVLAPPRTRVHIVDYSRPTEQAQLGPLSSPHLTPQGQGYPLSHDLARLLRQVQERGRQAALLAPRRGYSALLRCPGCESVPQCKNCDIPLRFHHETRRMTCHQCGYGQGVPDRCDECGEQMWKARGPGTEWIAQEVTRLLPGMPVYRLDRDHQDNLAPLYAGESGVVVGTPLLLSRVCPPDLALIGVTLADTWLGVSDFRASERYHRMLRQLAAWHPRRAPLLVVQTFQGDHPALRVLADGRDALAYPAAEAQVRRELLYPPAVRLAQIEVSARDKERACAAAQAVADALHGAGATEPEILGPAPSPVARLRGVYPYHLLLRARSDARLAELLGVLDTRSWSARVRVDVNPRAIWIDNQVGQQPW